MHWCCTSWATLGELSPGDPRLRTADMFTVLGLQQPVGAGTCQNMSPPITYPGFIGISQGISVSSEVSLYVALFMPFSYRLPSALYMEENSMLVSSQPALPLCLSSVFNLQLAIVGLGNLYSVNKYVL